MKEKMSSISVTAFEKGRIKDFLDWLRDTNASDKSIFAALREAKIALESKAKRYEESPTLQSMVPHLRQQIALLDELEEKLPRI